jgi:hypothetical protein
MAWAPELLLVLGAAWGLGLDRLARLRRLDRDTGDYWRRIATWVLYPLAGLLLLSWLSRSLGGWPGLYWDQAAGAYSRFYWGLLLAPFALWASALLAGLFVQPGRSDAARWLAGGIGFRNTRHWLLGQALLLAALLGFNWSALGGGAGAYPAALWSSLAVAALTLAGLAYSAGRAQPIAAAVEAAAAKAGACAPLNLKPWPELMAAAGLQAQTLAEWPATKAAPKALRDSAARNLASRLSALGAQGVAPELIEAMAALLRRTPPGNDGYGAVRVVFAPDDCGQTEALAVIASLLDRQSHTLSLVIMPQNAAAMAERLQSWLPEAKSRIVALDYGELPEDAAIWVVDAEILSDYLLPRLKDSPRSLARIGLVAWWQLHEYSGVQAANLWAITRRLHRLLRMHGREDLRTLALLRAAADSAQASDFVRRLLPHADVQSVRVHVPPRWAKPVSLHILQAQDNASEPRQYLLLRAAAASVAGQWPTAVAQPDFVTASEFAQFRGQTANAATLGEQLLASPAAAGVWLLQAQPADLLALPELLSQGGRAAPSLARHHVGILPPANPYMAYLLETLGQRRGFNDSRRLICAESCSAIIQRHLLLGLNELPETRDGLLQNALWEQKEVDETLRYLARQGRLSQTGVRYLNGNNRLSIDFEYRSREAPDDQFRPLDTVGLNLIKVRERAGGGREDGIRLRVDPERLLIMAYPGRVFMRKGQRYRINDWSSLEAAEQSRELECRQEDQSRLTWRRHASILYSIEPWAGADEIAFARQGRLKRRKVELTYEEEVTGRIEWSADPLQHRMDKMQLFRYAKPIFSKPFKTSAIVLRWLKEPEDANALPSLCQALRHVLPVHLGVEEDAVAIVSLNGENRIQGEEAFGLAIVDLYPGGGIGVVKAVADDDALWLNLLQSTHDWLEACQAETLQQHPLARAAGADQPPQPQAALSLLRQIL